MKFYRHFILALIVVGTLLSSFHQHSDGHVSDECQVCIIQHNLSSADIAHPFVLEAIECCFTAPQYVQETYVSKVFKYTLSRAPPSFS